MTILVTGGAGFIGSNFVREWIADCDEPVVNVDKLTYAGNLRNLESIANDGRHTFVRSDIVDRESVASLLSQYEPRAIVHFAAETHVDRSIQGPQEFIQTNVFGSFQLLAEALDYWQSLDDPAQEEFRFINVSTDEVFGSLKPDDAACTENSRYAPNSPYSASKAAADHLARAYFHTYGLPVITTHCTNNYGPYQFPEKLIPLMTINGARRKPLPIYGDGKNIRDWLYVTDHCVALRSILSDGTPGEAYNIAGNCEMTNVDVVNAICEQLDAVRPDSTGKPLNRLIEFITDRPGHDRRYALSTAKIEQELGWRPRETFTTGIRKTVQWYLDNEDWVQAITSGEYRQWIDLNYSNRQA